VNDDGIEVGVGSSTSYNTLDELARTPPRQLTDDGNAYRLIDTYASDVRYVVGIGWHVWDGTRWLNDRTGEMTRRARELVASLHGEANSIRAELDASDERVKSWIRHAKASGSRRRIEAMIALAASDSRVILFPDALDADPLLLNVPNGTVDLRTGQLRQHDRADLITRRTAVPYDPAAAAPTWRRFLKTVLPDPRVRRYAQRMAGQAAIGDNRDELLHVLHGGGANGKTKFSETVAAALGDYSAPASAELLLARRQQTLAQPELVHLNGVRLLAASETDEGRRLNVALVKALTGGDLITARLLYANELVRFVPVFSPWLRTNHRPAIRESSEAIWRRVRLVPFTVTIPKPDRDTGLQGKLYAELAGVLAWIVQGSRSYLKHGLTPPEALSEATKNYRVEEDVLGAFIDDHCLTGDDLTAPARDLYAAWKTWAEANGEAPGTATGFGRALTDAGFPRSKDTHGRRARVGLALRGPLDREEKS
jgi:putative DNA primase/helicase